MSGKATGWVVRNGPKRLGHRSVLMTIADQADIYGENARIDRDTIAKRSNRGRSWVNAVLRDLIADGWIEVVRPGGGRGHVAVYRLPGAAADLAGKGPVKGPVSEQKGAGFQDGKGPVFEPIAEVIPLLPKTVKPTTVEKGATPHSDAVHSLCDLLADRIAQLQDGARPEITNRWRDQMRLLIERGPLHRAQPEPMTPEKIATTIGFIFDHMAEPEGRGTFCWADQIRSAHALRNHWDQMKRAAEKLVRARRSPTAAILDRMSPGAGSTPLPVHLLPQTTQRRAIR